MNKKSMKQRSSLMPLTNYKGSFPLLKLSLVAEHLFFFFYLESNEAQIIKKEYSFF